MRPYWIGRVVIPAVALLAAACAGSQAPRPAPAAPSSTKQSASGVVHPANIKRMGRELPAGYEVTGNIPAAASPALIWGFAADRSTKPPQCTTLDDPGAGHDQNAQGVSGSGSGGIVDAVAVSVPLPGPLALDGDVVAACGQWSRADGRTTAAVHLIDAPRIDGTDTLGMVADIKTSVESGTEIDSRTYTFVAYLGDYYAFTTLTTDPGSVLPALSPQFAADLLVKTVSTLRS